MRVSVGVWWVWVLASVLSVLALNSPCGHGVGVGAFRILFLKLTNRRPLSVSKKRCGNVTLEHEQRKKAKADMETTLVQSVAKRTPVKRSSRMCKEWSSTSARSSVTATKPRRGVPRVSVPPTVLSGEETPAGKSESMQANHGSGMRGNAFSWSQW